jgi:hypothetical protein
MVNPTSQRQSRPRDQPSDHPMTTPSVPEPALAWVRASDDTNTRARPAVEQFDPSQNVYRRITRRGVPVRRVGARYPADARGRACNREPAPIARSGTLMRAPNGSCRAVRVPGSRHRKPLRRRGTGPAAARTRGPSPPTPFVADFAEAHRVSRALAPHRRRETRTRDRDQEKSLPPVRLSASHT